MVIIYICNEIRVSRANITLPPFSSIRIELDKLKPTPICTIQFTWTNRDDHLPRDNNNFLPPWKGRKENFAKTEIVFEMAGQFIFTVEISRRKIESLAGETKMINCNDFTVRRPVHGWQLKMIPPRLSLPHSSSPAHSKRLYTIKDGGQTTGRRGKWKELEGEKRLLFPANDSNV